jgi:small subunit ribosomal protein S16
MAVKMRLTRIGGKGKPVYRVVVANSESPRDGKFLEILGNYNPQKNPAEVILKEDRVRDWLAKGAQPTLTVSQLLEKKGIHL